MARAPVRDKRGRGDGGHHSMDLLNDAMALPCGHCFCTYALLCARKAAAPVRRWAHAARYPPPNARSHHRGGRSECILASLSRMQQCPLCKAATTRRALNPAPGITRLAQAFTALQDAYEADGGRGASTPPHGGFP